GRPLHFGQGAAGQGTTWRTSVTTYMRLPFWKTRASMPASVRLAALEPSAVSSALQIGSTRTSEEVASLSHQSLETSAIVAQPGAAAITLRASVSSLVTTGASRLV